MQHTSALKHTPFCGTTAPPVTKQRCTLVSFTFQFLKPALLFTKSLNNITLSVPVPHTHATNDKQMPFRENDVPSRIINNLIDTGCHTEEAQHTRLSQNKQATKKGWKTATAYYAPLSLFPKKNHYHRHHHHHHLFLLHENPPALPPCTSRTAV